MKTPQVIIGAQWGDEGKGKIVDFLSSRADTVVRFNGGNNAGHTIVLKGEKFPLSHLPSGVLWGKRLLIAQGCVLNPNVLLQELSFFKRRGLRINLGIDPRVNIVMPYHQLLDAATEESKKDKKVGSLKLGIGYCYEDRNNRHGIRLEDLVREKILREKLAEEFILKKKRIEGVYGVVVTVKEKDIFDDYRRYGKMLKKFITDVSAELSSANGKTRILFEGAHGTFLDANFGTYPYTTAVNTISGAVFPYCGIAPGKLDVIGVVKAYTTRVGGGPFPSELSDETGNFLQDKGMEFGTVSKRRRRCGWLDLPMLRLAQRLNGFASLAITKLDVLTGIPEVKVTRHYRLQSKKLDTFPSSLNDVSNVKPEFAVFPGWSEDITGVKKYQQLPKNCRKYLEYIEKNLAVPITYISVGRERSAIIKK